MPVIFNDLLRDSSAGKWESLTSALERGVVFALEADEIYPFH